MVTASRVLGKQRLEIVFNTRIGNQLLYLKQSQNKEANGALSYWLFSELINVDFDERHINIFLEMLFAKRSFLQ